MQIQGPRTANTLVLNTPGAEPAQHLNEQSLYPVFHMTKTNHLPRANESAKVVVATICQMQEWSLALLCCTGNLCLDRRDAPMTDGGIASRDRRVFQAMKRPCLLTASPKYPHPC